MRTFIYGSMPVMLDVDISELQKKIDVMREALSDEQAEKLLYRTFKEVAQKSRVLVAREAVKDYAVTQAWVKKNIGSYKLETGGNVRCIIPINSVKGTIGGRFKANQLRSGRISAKILKNGTSHLPEKMENQGGNKPFIGQGSLNGVAFTKNEGRLVRVVGLGVPQLPLNRSEDNTRDALLEYAEQRLDHNFYNMFVQGNA